MTQPSPALHVPESMGPKELGSYMRGLREHFKLSQQDVSERLHIRVRYVTAIEDAAYESMPGKVYARGYIHTYAEFLGLDADQVVAQCFPIIEEPPPLIAPTYTSRSAPLPPLGAKLNWRLFGMGFAAFVVLVVGYSQFSGDSSSPEAQTDAVAPVPESMLASLRSAVVPTARNYNCLTNDSALGCFFAQGTLQKMTLLQVEAAHPFKDEIDAATQEAAQNPPTNETLQSHD